MKTIEVFVLAEEFQQSRENAKTWQVVRKGRFCEVGDILLIQPIISTSDPNDRAIIARQVLHVMPLDDITGAIGALDWDICSTTQSFHKGLG